MKNVLIISSTNACFGAENVLFDYLKNNKGHNFYIYANDLPEFRKLKDNPFLNGHIELSSNMKIISIRRNTLHSLVNVIRNIKEIDRLVKKWNIDVIYGNNTLDYIYIVLYKKWVNEKVKTICHIHDIVQRKSIRYFIKLFKNKCDMHIVVSNAVKKSIANIVNDEKKIQVVYNGIFIDVRDNAKNIDELRIKYKLNNYIVLCFVGQLCERKRPDLFVSILNELEKRYPGKFYGLVVGSQLDTEPITYDNIIEKIENSSNIMFLGSKTREEMMSEVYPLSDALILTSDHDPLPTVILEKMALGGLVISRGVDGVLEIINNGENGIYWENKESVENICKIIYDVFLDKKSIKRMKIEAKRFVKESFSNIEKQRRINSIIEKI